MDKKKKPSKAPKPVFDMLEKLRSSHLVVIVGAIFLVDLAVPDLLPFIDEIVLGIATLLLARWRLRSFDEPDPVKPPPKNVTPPA